MKGTYTVTVEGADTCICFVLSIREKATQKRVAVLTNVLHLGHDDVTEKVLYPASYLQDPYQCCGYLILGRQGGREGREGGREGGEGGRERDQVARENM